MKAQEAQKQEQRDFVDRFGLCFEQFGGTRTMGRIYGWLLICDAPHQSLSELAAALEVSKAAISTIIRPMQEGGLVERLPSSTREHLYRLTPGGFTRVLEVQLERMWLGKEVAELGLSILDEDHVEQRERLEEFRDFCEFSAGEVRDELMRRWVEYRAKKKTTKKRRR